MHKHSRRRIDGGVIPSGRHTIAAEQTRRSVRQRQGQEPIEPASCHGPGDVAFIIAWSQQPLQQQENVTLRACSGSRAFMSVSRAFMCGLRHLEQQFIAP